MPALLVSKSPPLSGEVTIHGAKNSVLPILAATLLCRTPCVLHNCPDILDVTHTRAILHSLGCASERRGASVYIDSRSCAGHSIPPGAGRIYACVQPVSRCAACKTGRSVAESAGRLSHRRKAGGLSSACLPRTRRGGHRDGRYHSLPRTKTDRREDHIARPQRRRNRKRHAGRRWGRGRHRDRERRL